MEIAIVYKNKHKKTAFAIAESLAKNVGATQAETSSLPSLMVHINQRSDDVPLKQRKSVWIRGKVVKVILRGYSHDQHKIGSKHVKEAIDFLDEGLKQVLTAVYVAVPRGAYLCVPPDWTLCWGDEPKEGS